MDYGILVCKIKGRKYCGKSTITYRPLYRVRYEVFFFKEGEKRLGYISGKEFTFSKSFGSKAEMDRFLKELGIS